MTYREKLDEALAKIYPISPFEAARQGGVLVSGDLMPEVRLGDIRIFSCSGEHRRMECVRISGNTLTFREVGE